MIFNIRLWTVAVIAAFAASVSPASANAVAFEACVKVIRANALKAGVKADIVEAAFRDIEFDEKVVRFSRNQPEYRLKIWDYMAFLVDDARIADGKEMMKIEEKSLGAIEKAYGVDRFILAALWGVESDYGKIEGDFFLPQALASLACAGTAARSLQDGADPCAEDRRGGRCEAQGPQRLVGGRLRPHAVHALDLSPARRRFRPRRAQGHDQLRSRCACLERQFPQAVGLALGASLGLRGEGARFLQGTNRDARAKSAYRPGPSAASRGQMAQAFRSPAPMA